MDIRTIKKLLEIIEDSSVAEIEIHSGEESIRITRVSTTTQIVTQPQVSVPAQPPAATVSKIAEEAKPEETGHIVRSPMVGIFYRAPAPGAKPFVEVGQRVNVGDVLCIIEAMKILNQIEADKAGVVTKILVENGEPVEYNQPLFVIE
ncbi:acetyl-CoA carboxylase biotin carboxyl carrier protein [Methylothermus subterraneus]